MNKEQFSKIVANPNKLSKETLKDIKAVVDNFPYCQTAHILLAKGQHNMGSMMANTNIKKAALYTVDRKNLKKFIESKAVDLPEYIDLPEVSTEEAHPKKTDDAQDVPSISVDNQNEKNKNQEEESSIAIQQKQEDTDISIKAESNPALEEQTQSNIEGIKESTQTGLPISKQEYTPPSTNNTPNHDNDEFLSEVEKNLKALQEAKEKANNLLEKPIEIIAKQEEPIETTPMPTNTGAKEDIAKKIGKEKDTTKVNSSPKKEQKTKPTPKKEKKSSSESSKTPITYPKLNLQDEKIGFDIFSSRLGEMLHEKEDTTSAYTREFHPDLFLINTTQKNKKETPPKKTNTKDIIEKFIATEPSITPIKEKKKEIDPGEDLSANSSVLKGTLVTENMAKIYIKQENIKKAIEIYEALKLKYPEKKTYFADQISKLK